MAIVCIEGHRFDTEKAKRTWSLDFHDGNNMHYGDLYLSSRGTWYCETPSQWSNGHRWEIGDAGELVEQYGCGLDDDEKSEIFALAKLETE
jgi:hypothetical protein